MLITIRRGHYSLNRALKSSQTHLKVSLLQKSKAIQRVQIWAVQWSCVLISLKTSPALFV